MSNSIFPPEPLRALVVDDEELACRNLKRKLLELSEPMSVQTLNSASAAVCALRASAPDVVFLDIRMPELSGFDVLAHFPEHERSFAVVFCTAYDEHATQAFEVAALDYLVKPVDPMRLAAAMARVRRFVASKTLATPVLTQARAAGLTGWLERVVVRFRGTVKVIDVRDVVCLASEGHQAVAYTAQEEHVLESSLVALEAQLDPARFVRCHRAHLVQLSRIQVVERDRLSLDTGRTVPVSRRLRPQLLDAWAKAAKARQVRGI